tara:strand:+ start:187 stop:624 length:438 start_codon:yes stop_codon:yes gene_type:complete
MKMNHLRQEDLLVEVGLQVEIVLLVHQEVALLVLLEAVDLQRRAGLLAVVQVVAVLLSVVVLLSVAALLQAVQVAVAHLSAVVLLQVAQVVAVLLSEAVLLLVNQAAVLQRRAVPLAVALLSVVAHLVVLSVVHQSDILKPQVSI